MVIPGDDAIVGGWAGGARAAQRDGCGCGAACGCGCGVDNKYGDGGGAAVAAATALASVCVRDGDFHGVCGARAGEAPAAPAVRTLPSGTK